MRVASAVNCYRISNPDIARGDHRHFSFYDHIDFGNPVAADYNIAINKDLTAGVAFLAAEMLSDIGIRNRVNVHRTRVKIEIRRIMIRVYVVFLISHRVAVRDDIIVVGEAGISANSAVIGNLNLSDSAINIKLKLNGAARPGDIGGTSRRKPEERISAVTEAIDLALDGDRISDSNVGLVKINAILKKPHYGTVLIRPACGLPGFAHFDFLFESRAAHYIYVNRIGAVLEIIYVNRNIEYFAIGKINRAGGRQCLSEYGTFP